MSDSSGEGPQPLQSITLSNLLSFGPSSPPIPLSSLNVLIGPNGSGKSNFIEAIALLRATPSDLRSVIVRGGGAGEWIWEGELPCLAPTPYASIRTSVQIGWRPASRAPKCKALVNGIYGARSPLAKRPPDRANHRGTGRV